MRTGKAGKKIKRNIRSFEADEDVNVMLDNAQEDGVTLSTLCNLALRRFGPRIIREELTKQAEKALRWVSPPSARAGQTPEKQTPPPPLPDPDLEKIVHVAE
ncbi:MAG: hypothetical protein ACREFR_09020, partial [Limisphaerales bacterium]